MTIEWKLWADHQAAGIVATQCCCGSTSEALHSRSKHIFIHVFMYVCKYLFIYWYQSFNSTKMYAKCMAACISPPSQSFQNLNSVSTRKCVGRVH